MNNILEKSEKYLFNEKFLFFLGAVTLTLIAVNLVQLPVSIDPLFTYLMLIIGFLSIFFLVKISIKNTVIPYMLLQMTSIWMFVGPSLLAPLGLDFKPHTVVFGLSVLLTFYFIFNHFKYLWSFHLFRFTLIFFVINMFYALFYHSDFRNSNYIDIWIQSNSGLRFNAIASGMENYSRQFGHQETRFLIYLTGLSPLVGTVISLMTFYGAETRNILKEKMLTVIKYTSISYLVYLACLALSIIIGSNVILFISGRLTLNQQFTGDITDSLFLILLVGYNFYLSKIKDFPGKNFYCTVLNISIIIQSTLIIFGIKKGTIISTGVALAVLIAINALSVYNSGKKVKAEKESLIFKLLKLSPFVLILLFLVSNSELVNTTIYNLTGRFSSLETFAVRTTIWNDFTAYWADNLDFFKVLFGFGIDSARELTFFISALYPDKSFQQPHPHSIFLEMFYNYGSVALLYFIPVAIIFIQDFKRVLFTTDNKIRILSGMSIAVILNFLIFFMAECPSMPVHLIFFCTLGVLESAKRAFSYTGLENVNRRKLKN